MRFTPTLVGDPRSASYGTAPTLTLVFTLILRSRVLYACRQPLLLPAAPHVATPDRRADRVAT